MSGIADSQARAGPSARDGHRCALSSRPPRSTCASSACSWRSSVDPARASTSSPAASSSAPPTWSRWRCRRSGTAIMATGMVLIIVSRNIDLSVGSQVGVISMVYAVLMTDFLPDVLGFPEVGSPIMWIVALALGDRTGGAHRRGPGLHHRLRRRALVRGHARRIARPAGHRLGAIRRRGGHRRRPHVPPDRRRRQRLPRRRGDLAPGYRRVSRCRGLPRLQPAAASSLRVPAPAHVGRGAHRSRRLRVILLLAYFANQQFLPGRLADPVGGGARP